MTLWALRDATASRLNTATQADVDRWLELVLSADTLQAVLDN